MMTGEDSKRLVGDDRKLMVGEDRKIMVGEDTNHGNNIPGRGLRHKHSDAI